MGQITDNAIAWAQFRVAGGLKSSIWLAAAYATIVIAICGLIVMVNPGRSGRLDGAPTVLLSIQGIILGAVTVFRILNTIQRDTAAKLLESHRLMPIDPRLAVLGYAAGVGMPVLPIAVVNLLLGGIATSNAGLPMTWWFWANGVLLSWCVFAWCVAAGGAMLGQGIGMLILAPLLGVFMSAGLLTLVVPGLAPMVSPLVGKAIFRAQSVGSEELVRWVICLALELSVAWVIVLAGARRFRAGEIPGLSGVLGSALVLLFALSSIVAVVDPDMVPAHVRREGSAEARHVGTIIAMMVLGSLVAMSHVARHAVELPDRYRGKSLWIRDAGVVLVVVGGAAAFLLAVPDLPANWLERTLWTVSELVIVVVSMLLWTRWFVRRGTPVAMGLVMMGVCCVLPLIAGAFLGSDSALQEELARKALQVSPMAMIPAIWDVNAMGSRVPSLLLQLALPAAAAVLLWKGGRPAGVIAESLAAAPSFTDSPAPVDSHRL